MTVNSTPSIRFIYFDLDDTLLDHGAAELAALRELHSEYSTHLKGVAFSTMQSHYRRINRKVWHKYSDGDLSKEEAKTLRFFRLADAIGLQDRKLVEELPDAYLDRYANHWTPIDRAFETYRLLAKRVEVGILTNGFAETQRSKLNRFPELEAAATHVIISEEIGSMKPDPDIFAHATETAGVQPNEVLYVGDSLRSDVEGGTAFGWNVAWYRGDKTKRSDVFCFSDWQDLQTHAEDALF